MALLWEVILIGQMAGGAPEEEEQGCGWGAGGGRSPNKMLLPKKLTLGVPAMCHLLHYIGSLPHLILRGTQGRGYYCFHFIGKQMSLSC